MADATVAAGAELIIWSTLPNVTEMTNGKQTGIKHFDSKATVEQYIHSLPIKSAFYMPSLYMQMKTDMFRPKAVSPHHQIVLGTNEELISKCRMRMAISSFLSLGANIRLAR